MGSSERRVDVGSRRGRDLTATVLRELRLARLDRNLSGATLAAELGMSGAQYSRIERGLVRGLSIEQASALLAAVGLDLSIRVYPGGQPLRDAAHAALLDRLRSQLHRSLRVLAEVPFPTPGDLQALERRLALKFRDGGVDGASLLLLDSKHNREFVRANAASLMERFPVPGRRALELLRAGVDPGAGSVILL